MKKKYYIQANGKVNGPLSGKDLMSLARLGKLLPTHMVRQDGSDKWIQANRIKELDFATPEEEPGEETEEVLELEIEEVLELETDNSNSATPGNKLSNNQNYFINYDLPPAPSYGFVDFVAVVYNVFGVLTLIGSTSILIYWASQTYGNGYQKASLIFGTILGGIMASITCFATAQLFAMAIDGSKNLHYIMHSNLVAMRVIVRQFSKKD